MSHLPDRLRPPVFSRDPERRLPLLFVGLLAAVVLTGCGGGGPGVSGPEARSLFEDYSGTWVLDTLASDPVPEMAEGLPGRGGGGPFGGGGPPGGGGMGPGGGGPPSGGMGPGRGGGPGGGMGPAGGGMLPGGRVGGRGPSGREAMEANRHLLSLVRQRPTRVTLALDDSLFTVTESPGTRAVLPMDGEEREVPAAAWPTRARVGWEDLQPRFEREIEDGGRVVDHFEVVGGRRLILTRTVESGRIGELRMVFAYDRAGG